MANPKMLFDTLDTEELKKFISNSASVLTMARQALTARGELTPPTIVARSDDPAEALVIFIAQELEAWGFGVKQEGEHFVQVKADDRELNVLTMKIL